MAERTNRNMNPSDGTFWRGTRRTGWLKSSTNLRGCQRQYPSERFDGLTKENDGSRWTCWTAFPIGSASTSVVSSAKKREINHIQPAQNSIDDRPHDRVVLRI